jgi:hypothetical protein
MLKNGVKILRILNSHEAETISGGFTPVNVVSGILSFKLGVTGALLGGDSLGKALIVGTGIGIAGFLMPASTPAHLVNLWRTASIAAPFALAGNVFGQYEAAPLKVGIVEVLEIRLATDAEQESSQSGSTGTNPWDWWDPEYKRFFSGGIEDYSTRSTHTYES